MDTKKYEVVVASWSEVTGLECTNCGKEMILDGSYIVGLKTKRSFFAVCEDEPSTCCSAKPLRVKSFKSEEDAQTFARKFDADLTRTETLDFNMLKLNEGMFEFQRTGLNS